MYDSKRLLELAGVQPLTEAKELFKLYTQNAYGGGLSPKPIKKDTYIVGKDGEDVLFVGIKDEKTLMVKIKGKSQEMSVKDVSGKVLPASTKPEGKDFIKEETLSEMKKGGPFYDKKGEPKNIANVAMADHREDASDVLRNVDNQLKVFGLQVVMYETDDDSYIWAIAKK